ncbi:MAG: CPXCG motif-containing cysteine-rich protein [Psychroflexus maritimus]
MHRGEEIFYQCPHCWEEVSIIVDLSHNMEEYVEDCEVCCNPISFIIKVSASQVVDFQATTLDQ